MNSERRRHTVAALLAAGLWGTTGTVAHHAPAGSNQALVGLATFDITAAERRATAPTP
ncbi:hypothetical protein [Nostocoides australiense]|nr:hypothetical protein [Tetrasphaera australiensis]